MQGLLLEKWLGKRVKLSANKHKLNKQNNHKPIGEHGWESKWRGYRLYSRFMGDLVCSFGGWKTFQVFLMDKDSNILFVFFSVDEVLSLKTINAGFVPLQYCNVYTASGPKSSSIELKHSMCCGVHEVCFALLCTSISWLRKKTLTAIHFLNSTLFNSPPTTPHPTPQESHRRSSPLI